jgi:predicted glycosyltransferase
MYWGDLNILPRPIRQSLLVLGGREITISTITFSVNRQIRAEIEYNGFLVSAMRRA